VAETKTQAILALDFDRLEDAVRMVGETHELVSIYKVGSILFTGYGSEVIEAVRAGGGEVFLDLKFHDIPNTVRGAVRAAAAHGVSMLTVHASGGIDMMRGALEGAGQGADASGNPRPRIVGVTMLTSHAGGGDTLGRVIELAGSAAEAGLDGVVCSVAEVGKVKEAYGERLLTVVPGIRLSDQAKDDQARVGTPRQAVRDGADYIVVGRSVTKSPDPKGALTRILEEVANA
jgi:orotidine-5'-phosphate decarboxylase